MPMLRLGARHCKVGRRSARNSGILEGIGPRRSSAAAMAREAERGCPKPNAPRMTATSLRLFGPPQRLFSLSPNHIKVLNQDIAFAGIAKHDERGRTVCVHSLRHTFATLMSMHGVNPRVAQAAMRHSSIDLTMRVYTDPRLLDVAAAIDALPAMPTPTIATGT